MTDSDLTAPPAAESHDAVIAEAVTIIDQALGQMTVSYTHLTLPTICSV